MTTSQPHPPTITQRRSARRLFRRKRVLVLAVSLTGAVVVLAAITFCQGGPRYYNRKYGTAPQRQPLSARPGHFTLESQTEPHTCGFHSVSTVYRAFGIDPLLADLRYRLGTDRQAHIFDTTTLGTIHPDLLRVMKQDGFDCELLLSPADDVAKVQSHLAAGFSVIILSKPKGLHWTVLVPGETSDEAVIYDSLQPQPIRVDMKTYVQSSAISAILVRPAG
jgi:hypothetical protein